LDETDEQRALRERLMESIAHLPGGPLEQDDDIGVDGDVIVHALHAYRLNPDWYLESILPIVESSSLDPDSIHFTCPGLEHFHECFAAFPFAHIRLFVGYGSEPGDHTVDEVLRVPDLSSVHRLELDLAGITPLGITALARSHKLANLRVLDLHGNDLGDEGCVALASAAYLPNLDELGLEACGVTDEGVEALRSSDRLPSLSTLHLARNPLSTSYVLELLRDDRIHAVLGDELDALVARHESHADLGIHGLFSELRSLLQRPRARHTRR